MIQADLIELIDNLNKIRTLTCTPAFKVFYDKSEKKVVDKLILGGKYNELRKMMGLEFFLLKELQVMAKNAGVKYYLHFNKQQLIHEIEKASKCP